MPDEGFDPQPTTVPGVEPDDDRTVDSPTGAQPEIAARMAPQLRLTQVGNGIAVLALVFSLVSLVTIPDSATRSSGRGWAVSALVASAVMLVICTFQQLAWLRALAVWRGQRHDDVRQLTRVSFTLHLVSYVVVVFGLWACISGSVAVGTTATAAALLAFALLFLVVAQVLGAVQYVRSDGPSGTIPAYLRKLSRAIESRR